MEPPIQLSSIASNTATAAYQELAALLHTLPRNDDPTRKKRILHFAVRVRHRIARLLVLIRWTRQYGHLTNRTLETEDIACNTIDALEDVADALWDAHRALPTSVTARPAVASAVDVLTAGSLTRLPRVLPSAAHDKQKTVLATEVSEVTQEPGSPYAALQGLSSKSGADFASVAERLGIATRNCVRESQLHCGNLQVLQWRSGPADVCVRVGVHHWWHADVSLDSLDPDNALLRVHAIHVGIRNDIDVEGVDRQGAEPQPVYAQDAELRRAADDRMHAALVAARSIAKGMSFVATCAMLFALRDMMMDDVCAPLAMDNLRMQALGLSDGRWKCSLQVEGAKPETPRSEPLVIRYWLEHRQPAVLRISEAMAVSHASKEGAAIAEDEGAALERMGDARLERKAECVTCTHEPALPSAVELGESHSGFELKMNELNLENLILACIRLRSRARLKAMAECFLRKHRSLRIHPSCIELSQPQKLSDAGEKQKAALLQDVLFIHLAENGRAGMQIRVFALTGGVRIRPYGAAALELQVPRYKDSALWSGAKHFVTATQEMDAVLNAFEAVRARVKLNASARSVCALDIGVSNTLPPGTASVAATASPDRAASQLVPPFAPLERRAPRRFLTLSPPPPAKTIISGMHGNGSGFEYLRTRTAGSRGMDRGGTAKRPRLTYATTSDALVFIQESSFAGEDWQVGPRNQGSDNDRHTSKQSQGNETDWVDRYNGTAAAAAAWAVTRDVVERRLRRDSLLRAFVAANVASAAQMHHLKASEDGDLHLESASRVLLKVKCEPLPVRRAELLLRGYDSWQVRLSLLPPIFDSTDPLTGSDQSPGNSRGDGNLWSVGVACIGSQLTFTYPSANAASVRSFFRDLTRARTAAALARGVPPSPFYRVLRRSPVRIVVGIGPYKRSLPSAGSSQQSGVTLEQPPPKPLYTATVEYVYSKGNSGGFSLSFSPSKPTMEQLAPLIEEALDASGGQVGGILAGLLERACPLAAAAESAVRERGRGKIRFVTALRVRAMFAAWQENIKVEKMRGQSQGGNAHVSGGHVFHAVDVDARGSSGMVTVIDVGRATAVMRQQGLAPRPDSSGLGVPQRRIEFVPIRKWDDIVASLTRAGYAETQRAGSTVLLRMEALEQFLLDLVTSAGSTENKRQ